MGVWCYELCYELTKAYDATALSVLTLGYSTTRWKLLRAKSRRFGSLLRGAKSTARAKKGGGGVEGGGDEEERGEGERGEGEGEKATLGSRGLEGEGGEEEEGERGREEAQREPRHPDSPTV
eukprot:1167663-Rhodomonas_salina.1